jgi:cyclase
MNVPRSVRAAVPGVLITLLGSTAPALAQQDFAGVEIETIPVADGVYMLVGQGGNIGLSVGDDGAFLVDDQYAPLTERILAAVREVGGGDVKFVVNTHWHGDHTGGNENLRGEGAIIFAHENVRARMSTEQFLAAFNQRVPPSPSGALPVVTFPDQMTFHWNDKTVHVYHVPNAHTDGDSIVHYTDRNAFHMGDIFFNGMYPFIDVSSGGSLPGMVAAVETVLERADEDSRIIPGHGPLANTEDLRGYHEMLSDVHDRILSLIERGMSEDEVVTANPTEPWEAEYGGGFMSAENFTRFAYQSMTR